MFQFINLGNNKNCHSLILSSNTNVKYKIDYHKNYILGAATEALVMYSGSIRVTEYYGL